MKLTCVISGGQTGADIGGVAAAKSMGTPTGGWMPKHWLTEDGHHPEYAELYGMREGDGGYMHRTIQNILDADATLIIAGDWSSRGTIQTDRYCQREGKINFKVKLLDVALGLFDERQGPMDLAAWLKHHNVKILNVAGNRESRCPGIGSFTYGYVRAALAGLALL